MGTSSARVRESRIWESPAVKSKLRCRSLASQFYADVSGVSRLTDASPRHCASIGVFARRMHRHSPKINRVYTHCVHVCGHERRDNPRAINILSAKRSRPGSTKLSTRMRAEHANMEHGVYHLFNCCLTNIATNFKHRREAYASC